MRGQISFVEFLVAMVIFISIASYIFFTLIRFIPQYLGEARNERIRVEAYQLTELLVNDPGEPTNWDRTTVIRPGLLDETQNKTNLLSSNKINVFNTNCKANFNNVKNQLGSDFDFSILLVDRSDGSLKINCRPERTDIRVINISIRRVVAISPSGFGELILQMW